MSEKMTIGVVAPDRYAKYDQFDPLAEKLDLFHEECAGGRVRIVEYNEGVSRYFQCDACGAQSPGYRANGVRAILRPLLACRTPVVDESACSLIPIPPPPQARGCRACGLPVDPQTDEYAVFHFAGEHVVYVHADCSPAANQASPTPDDERLKSLLHELRVIARRQSDPIRRRGAT